MEGLLLSRETQNSVNNNGYGNKIVDENWKNTSKRENKTYQIDFSDLGISNDIAMEIIEESKGLNERNSYSLRSDYLDDDALRVLLIIYRNIIKKGGLDYKKAIEFLKRFIESEVGVSFDEFYNNTADIFEFTGFNSVFHFDRH